MKLLDYRTVVSINFQTMRSIGAYEHEGLCVYHFFRL